MMKKTLDKLLIIILFPIMLLLQQRMKIKDFSDTNIPLKMIIGIISLFFLASCHSYSTQLNEVYLFFSLLEVVSKREEHSSDRINLL